MMRPLWGKPLPRLSAYRAGISLRMARSPPPPKSTKSKSVSAMDSGFPGRLGLQRFTGACDQAIGGCVMRVDIGRGHQFVLDGACKNLAQFHAPLVEAVDAPDDALHEDLVFVQCDQRTKTGRRQR